MLPWSRIAFSRSRQELGAVESRDRDDAGSLEPVALLPCSQQVPMLTTELPIDYGANTGRGQLASWRLWQCAI